MFTPDHHQAKITAQGEKIRSLKASGADVKGDVATLLALKAQYKALTGKDYAVPKKDAPAGKQKKQPPPAAAAAAAAPVAAGGGGEGGGAAAAAGDGPSKSELKRLAKKAEKAEKNQKKADNKEDTSTSPGAAAGGAGAAPGRASAALTAAGPTAAAAAALELLVEGPNAAIALHKCLAASALIGVAIEPAGARPAGGLPADATLSAPGGAVVFGANAVCRYLFYRAAETSAAAAAVSAVTEADGLLEWEEKVLAPALLKSNNSGGSAEALPGALAELEAKLAGGKKFLLGDEPSLADAVVGISAVAAVEAAGGASAAPAAVKAYAARVAAAEFCAAAKAAAPAFDSPTDDGRGLLATLTELFSAAIISAYPEAAELGVGKAAVFKCPNYNHGDFQCNNAMALHRALKAAGVANVPPCPQDVAAALISAIPPGPLVQGAAVAGPGFINIRLRPSFISRRIGALARDGALAPPLPPSKRLKIAVDFSSPNIAKEMHVGHLRSTIIGDTICRVLEFCGHEVLRINHIGDWGTQFGMLINYMKESQPGLFSSSSDSGAAGASGAATNGGGGGSGGSPSITDLTGFYKAAKKRFDESEDFKEVSRQTVVKLQAGDPDCRRVWEKLCEISRLEFQKVYDRLHVRLNEFGESFYNPLIPSAIAALEELGMVKQDNGAAIISLPHFTYPLIVRKSDGGYGYDSTDMAAVRYRLQELRCDWLVYITDDGQSSHFSMVFDAARAAGWAADVRIDHIGFGVVKGDDGKKFKTRSGETVRLVDLLDEAVARMEAVLRERVAEGKSALEPEAVPAAAAAIGYGAVKYFDLRQHPATAYTFSYDRMLDTRGNTAVYLLYTHARLASILRKARDEYGVDLEALRAGGAAVSIDHPSERALAFELLQFPDVLAAAVATLLPHGICDYLYELATKFTDFVTNCHVLGSAEREGRLLLCEATGAVMRRCLEVIGIQALDRI